MQPIKFATLVIILLHILTIHIKFLSLHCQNTLPQKFLSPFNLIRSLRENQPLMKHRLFGDVSCSHFVCCNKCWFHTQWEVPSLQNKALPSYKSLVFVFSSAGFLFCCNCLCFHEIINWHYFWPFLWAKNFQN